MFKPIAIAATLITLITVPVLAQAPPPGLAWVRGTVDKLDGDKLTVKMIGAKDMTVELAANTRIQILVKKSVTDIKVGDFLVSAGIKGKDGKIHAVEVRILPQPAPDGGRQFNWDLAPDSVMTNATVGTVTNASDGTVLHVKFTGGEAEYSIGPDVPVLAPAAGDKSLLTPGAAVFAFCRKAPDGGLTAAVVYVEKNGIKPPM